ncbi:3'-5' exonuclease [Accumulibacter sp.]|uniref:3'-5' exonuclease n=1 Tax=Accumulibacter sp. TaxID=2053492 RepID=UPI0028C4A8FF|nr:3'-5' exonuclease [Accumulibacter sp.]
MSDVVLNRTSLRAAAFPAYPGIAIANVRLVDSQALCGEALDVLMAADVIGFDSESKPTFRQGEASTGPHLVQLATETRAYLFQVSRLPGIDELKAILESPRLLKVGFGLGNDRSALRSRLGIEIDKVLDLGEVLRGPGHRGTVGAKVAVAHFFAQTLQKSRKIGTSNWATARLSERQQLYAANDAHVALQIYRAWAASGSGALPE